MSEQIADSAEIRNVKARQAGLAAAASLAIDPTDLIRYQSNGHVCIIGDASAIAAASRLDGKLQTQVLLLDEVIETDTRELTVRDREIRIDGYLGAFRIQLGEKMIPIPFHKAPQECKTLTKSRQSFQAKR